MEHIAQRIPRNDISYSISPKLLYRFKGIFLQNAFVSGKILSPLLSIYGETE